MMKNSKNMKAKSRFAEVQTSMPQLRPPKYLTKEDNNQEFHKNYEKKIEQLQSERQATEDEIEDMELNLKRLDEEESIANVMPADKQKLKKLIPIYRDKRKIKDELKKLKDELVQIKQHLDKVTHTQQNLALRESVFAAANIDIHKVREKKRKTGEYQNQYYDKKIDQDRLKQLKRGLYLDIIENANFAKLSYKKNEKKYDVGRIIENQKQYEQDNALRFETAAQRHKAYQNRLEKRFVNMKMMRNAGMYNPQRNNLYPDELFEGGDADYYDQVYGRGYSASSAGRIATSARSRVKV